ncbi:MAG: hypothetical protein Kow00128_13490 [Deltaproteobacteria bacterium]
MRSTIAVLLLVLFLAAAYLVASPGTTATGTSYDYRTDPNITSWLSKKEAERLMRYHGVQGLKITDREVFIHRDNRWVCVYHDPPYPLEISIVAGTPKETVVARAERP